MNRLWRLSPHRLWALIAWAWGIGKTIRGRRRETRLTVAVDVNSLWEPLTGIGWSLYRLLEHLADRDDLRLRLYGPDVIVSPDLLQPPQPLPEGPAIEIVRYEPPAETLAELSLGIKILRRLRPLLIAADGNRIVYAPNFFPPRAMTLARGALVATVHDLGYRFFADTLADDTLAELETKMSRVFETAARIITPTEAVRAEIISEGLAQPEAVRAIHHGPGQLAATIAGERPHDLPETYALWVGTLEPRKNLAVLIDAWNLLVERGIDPPTLVLVGRFGWKATALARQVEAASEAGWLLHLGYVSNERLAELYRFAHLFCFPSRYEGFGLPLLEAMSLGVPTLASDLPVLKEVGGNGARYANPDDPEEWAERIADLLARPESRLDLANAARDRAAQFSWQETARETLAVFRQAARDDSSSR